MGEGDAAVARGGVKEIDAVAIGVAVCELLENPFGGPGEERLLKERLIDRKIEGVHHAIFALVHDVEELSVRFGAQQLAAGEVSADRVGKQKVPFGRGLLVFQFGVHLLAAPMPLGLLLQGCAQHRRKAGVVFQVGIAGRYSRACKAGHMPPQSQRQIQFLSRLHAHGKSRTGPEKVRRTDQQVFAEAFLQGKSSEGGEPRTFRDGHAFALLAQDGTHPRLVKHGEALLLAAESEYRQHGLGAEAVVYLQAPGHGRQASGGKRLSFSLRGIWHRPQGSVQFEGEPWGFPAIGAESHAANDVFGGNRFDAQLRFIFPNGKCLGVAASGLEEGEQFEVTVLVQDTHVDVVISGAASIVDGKAAGGAVLSEREAAIGAKGAVLGVEVH